MKTSLNLLIAFCLISMLTACGNNTSGASSESSEKTTQTAVASATNASAAAATLPVLSVDAYRPPPNVVAQDSPMKPRDMKSAPVATNITLGAPLSSQADTARKNNETAAADHMGKPLQIGFGRDVTQTATASATNQILKWQATAAGGQVAAINFSSTGAKGIRIGLLITQLPASATLRFYAKGDATAFEVKGAEVLAVIAKNVASGDTSNDARTYWSPVLKTNNGTVEIEIPAGVVTNDIQVSVPIISHLFMSMSDAKAFLTQSTYDATDPDHTGNTGLACQVDVKCTTPLPAASDAVAWLIYNKSGGFANICSGTLLNDNLNSGTPYVLTANHCISTQTFASTLFTEFKYRSLACNNAATGEYYPTATTGAALLYTAYNTDSTLLRLYGAPSTNVLFAGWDATVAPAVAISIHSIHHPRGDQQRLSRGTVTGYSVRSPTDPEIFPDSNITNGTILDVTLTTGLTERGSSGSALLKGTDANPQVIGQLFGGSLPACGLNANNVYGRCDVAYNAGMSDWLNQGIKRVSRFYNTASGTHFYSMSTTESNYIKATFPSFSFEGTPFGASSVTAAGLSPVYRFYNLNLGVHFYTISESERAFVIANLPQMRYEGVAWYSNATSVAGSVPLYRFYNRDKGVHFYTVSTTERDFVIANLPQMNSEGIAYYVLP